MPGPTGAGCGQGGRFSPHPNPLPRGARGSIGIVCEWAVQPEACTAFLPLSKGTRGSFSVVCEWAAQPEACAAFLPPPRGAREKVGAGLVDVSQRSPLPLGERVRVRGVEQRRKRPKNDGVECFFSAIFYLRRGRKSLRKRFLFLLECARTG